MSLKLAPLGAAVVPNSTHNQPSMSRNCLTMRPWKERALYGHERELLEAAREFLDKVRDGKEIVRQTATHRDHYSRWCRVIGRLRNTREKPWKTTPWFSSSRGFRARERRIDEAYEVIATVLEGEQAARSLPDSKLTATGQLFGNTCAILLQTGVERSTDVT